MNNVNSFAQSTMYALFSNTDKYVLWSWGISHWISKVITDNSMQDIPVLGMKVNGFLYQGYVFIGMQAGTDKFRIFLVDKGQLNEVAGNVKSEDLGKVIDSFVETKKVDEAYKEKVYKEYCC